MRFGRLLEERDRSARVADRARDLAEAGERAGPKRSIVRVERGGEQLLGLDRLAERRARARASSNGSRAARGRPEASSSASAPRRLASRRRSCSDGMRSPFSSRDTYAGVQIPRASARWLIPARSRAERSRRANPAAESTWSDFWRGIRFHYRLRVPGR